MSSNDIAELITQLKEFTVALKQHCPATAKPKAAVVTGRNNLITHYNIYCITEGKFVDGYGADPPTHCYNNVDHEINPDSIQILDPPSANTVALQDELIPTGGNHQTKGFSFVAAPGPNNFDITFPYPINIFNIRTQTENVGDVIDCVIDPNYSLGAGSLTSDVAIGDTVINVNPDKMFKLYLGLEVVITDGVQVDFANRIVDYNSVTNTVTVAAPTQNAYSKDTAVIKTNLYVIRDYPINMIGAHDFEMKSGAQYIPTGTVIRMAYLNTSNSDKNVGVSLQYAF